MSCRWEKENNSVIPSSTVESSPLCKSQPDTGQLLLLLTVPALELPVCDSYAKYLLHSSPWNVPLLQAEQVLWGHVAFHVLEAVNIIIRSQSVYVDSIE